MHQNKLCQKIYDVIVIIDVCGLSVPPVRVGRCFRIGRMAPDATQWLIVFLHEAWENKLGLIFSALKKQLL